MRRSRPPLPPCWGVPNHSAVCGEHGLKRKLLSLGPWFFVAHLERARHDSPVSLRTKSSLLGDESFRRAAMLGILDPSRPSEKSSKGMLKSIEYCPPRRERSFPLVFFTLPAIWHLCSKCYRR